MHTSGVPLEGLRDSWSKHNEQAWPSQSLAVLQLASALRFSPMRPLKVQREVLANFKPAQAIGLYIVSWIQIIMMSSADNFPSAAFEYASPHCHTSQALKGKRAETNPLLFSLNLVETRLAAWMMTTEIVFQVLRSRLDIFLLFPS